MRSIFRLAILATVAGTPHFSAQVETPIHVISSTGRTDSADRATGIEVAVVPELPFIGNRQGQQLVNFDLLLKNPGPESYNLVAIKLSVFDSSRHLELKRELNENGSPPALDMIAERTLHRGEVTDVFQPFYAFGPEIDLSRMHLEFLFVRSGDRVQPVAVTADEKISVDVRPRAYSPAAFCLPLRGLTLSPRRS